MAAVSNTLAVSFLADFESDGEAENNEEEDLDEEVDMDTNTLIENVELQEFDLDDLDDEDTDDSDDEMADSKRRTYAAEISSLLAGSNLDDHLKVITELQEATRTEEGRHEDVDAVEEYDVIVRSNELCLRVDDDIASLHKYIREVYATKYSELEDLVYNPLEYAKCVKVIGNLTDLASVEGQLSSILPAHVVLSISVAAMTTVGKPLPDEDLKRVTEACDGMIELNDCKNKIFDYIESRMTFIAPNVTNIVGHSIAARLMGVAGGLPQLSKIPACNLQVLGSTKKNLAGYGAGSVDLHLGLIAQTDLVLSVPKDLKYRTVRLIAGKTALACRIDHFGTHKDGSRGLQLRATIEKKIEKWQEPPPPKSRKALPIPLAPPRKKRGGKRYRKMREKYRITDTMKAKNRMAFGKPELTDEYTGEGFGMLGQRLSGHVAIRRENNQKLSKSLSKKTKVRLKRLKTASSGSSGLSSSIAFTPVQGMEFVDHTIKKHKESERYFSATGGFFQVGQKRVKTSD